MPLDDLPGKYIAPLGSDIVAQFKRDIVCHDTTASTDDGTLAAIDAATTRDSLSPIFYNAQLAANAAASLDDMSLTQLRKLATSIGLPDLLPATGSTGFGSISASSGGGFIAQGATATNQLTNIQYEAIVGGTYQNGAGVELIALETTGPQTDCAAGTVLKWDSPQGGINPLVIVLVDSNGNGLSGGSPAETQSQLIERIKDAYASPPAAGNDAEVRAAAKGTAGVAVEETFTFPAIWGSGTTAYVFTTRPQTLADGVTPIPSSRIPSGVQETLVSVEIEGQLPGDDGPIACTLFGVPQNIALQVVWDASTEGWADSLPWPNWSSAQPVQVSSATSATVFTLDCSGNTLSGSQLPPQPGMHIAFFNKASNAFVEKTILTATSSGGGLYAIVCEKTFGASDTVYKPSVGEWCCPWSDSLKILVPLTYVSLAALGAGEQVSPPFFDAGTRWKRQPTSPAQWPSVIGQRSLAPYNENSAIDDASYLFPVIPYQTPVGVKAVSSNLLVEGGIYAFAQ